jgi:hypothetical protein
MPDTGRSPTVPRRDNRLVDALMIGLPDAITSLWCLWVWIHPLAFGADTVKCVVLMMLMEFILLNATGLFTAIPFMVDFGRGFRLATMLGMCTVYLLLIAGFAMQFHAIWPYFTFGWLAAAKLGWIARNRRVSSTEQIWLIGAWAITVVAYLGAVGIGVTQELPRLGITEAILPSLHLPAGGGEWIDQPYKAVASAVFYFAAVALFKWMYVAIRKTQPDRGQRGGGMDSSAEDLSPAG